MTPFVKQKDVKKDYIIDAQNIAGRLASYIKSLREKKPTFNHTLIMVILLLYKYW